MSKPEVILSDTVMVGDWPRENCHRCGGGGVKIIHWGLLAARREDGTRITTLFCRGCWLQKHIFCDKQVA